MKSKIILFTIFFFGLFGVASPKLGVGGLVGIAEAATVTAASCENKTGQTDVQNAIDLASDGDVVSVPSGSCDWTTAVTITKKITLQGSGSTTIDTGYVSNSIIMSVPAGTQYPLWRITGFNFIGNGTTGSIFTGPILINYGSGSNWRIDHNTFTDLHQERAIYIQTSWGVIDHNTFYRSTHMTHAAIVGQQCVNSGCGDKGYASWSTPYIWGTPDAIFIEDNNWTMWGVIDGWNGARFVVRHNTILNSQSSWHGFDSGNNRGAVGGEIYNNDITRTYSGTNSAKFHELRSGTVAFHNNTIKGLNAGAQAAVYRAEIVWWSGVDANSWPIADGTKWYMCSDHLNTACSPTVMANCGPLNPSWPDCSGAQGNWPNPDGIIGTAYCQARTCSGKGSVACASDATCANLGYGTCTGAYVAGATSTCTSLFCSGDRETICDSTASPDPCIALGKGTCSSYVDADTSNGYPSRDMTGIGPGPGQNKQPLMSWGNSICTSLDCTNPVLTSSGIITGQIQSMTSSQFNLQEGVDFFNCTSQSDCETRVNAYEDSIEAAHTGTYTAYPYPHPLTLTGDSTPPAPPTGLSVQ